MIDTTEMYLKTVFELHEAGVPPMRARIAERLGHSGPTVSQTVARMERDDLLHLDEERRIHLTATGQAIATDVMRKHRLAERHLIEALGLPFELVHEEACRWEHVMSKEVETRIAAQIAPPYVDPYGNPIPGLAELGIEEAAVTAEGQETATWLVPLETAVNAEGPVRMLLRRIGEPVQTDVDLLRELAGQGVLPGAIITAQRREGGYLLRAGEGGGVAIDSLTASQLSVAPAPSE
nr:metal-dependent transcriptional regulator [Brachybacterium equifaecis]